MILIFMINGLSYSQNPLLENENYKNAQIRIMEIENFQTANYLQSEKSLYINDFQILENYKPNRKQKKKIRKILTNSYTYFENTSRPCPFIANYAIQIKTKNTTLEIIISGEFCPKIMIKNVYANEIIYFDLKKNCEIYKLFEELLVAYV